MDKPDFVYVTYILSTPEKVWNALTNGEITKQYWFNHRNTLDGQSTSDWQVGATWRHENEDQANHVDVIGTVTESAFPTKLVVTWMNPGETDSAKSSRVTYDIVQGGETVRLTVTHDKLESDPKMAQSISGGWPKVLSNLKSFLETGASLPKETYA